MTFFFFYHCAVMGHSNKKMLLPILQVTEEYQAVNVSVKTDIWRSEVKALFFASITTIFMVLAWWSLLGLT